MGLSCGGVPEGQTHNELICHVSICVYYVCHVGGEDFVPGGISGTFTPGGDTEICMTVPLLNDAAPENCAETFLVMLSSDDAAIGSPSQVQIQILDDDGMKISMLLVVLLD